MKRLLWFLTFVVWALWFGGTIAVFVFGWSFQKRLAPETFHESARALLQVFANYELVLAGIALLCSGALLVVYPSKGSILLVGCLVLAAGMAVTVALGLIPMMESLRVQGLVNTDQWRKLHGKSMGATAMQAMVLLGAGWVILHTLASTPFSDGSKSHPFPAIDDEQSDASAPFETIAK